MGLTRSQLEAINPDALHGLAAQVASVHEGLTQHADTHDQVWRDLDDAWRGRAADTAGDSVDKHMRWLRANAEGVQQLQSAVSAAAADLGTAKSNVLTTVADLEAKGYTIGDDWSITAPAGQSTAPASHTAGPATTNPASAHTAPAGVQPDDHQANVAALQNALSTYGQTEQQVGQNIQAAYQNIQPIQTTHPAPTGDPANWDTQCHISGKLTWDEFTDEQKNNARDIYAVGHCLGMSQDEIQLALMTALLESHMYNIGDNSMAGSEAKADGRNGKKCMGHTDPSDLECGGGLFQQHPFDKKGNWGTTDEIMDPVQAATMFYMGRCTPGGNMADGIWEYTRTRGIAIDPSAEDQYLYQPQNGDPSIKVADGSPKSARPWAIAQAIQRPSMLERHNGDGPAPSYASNWGNAQDIYGKLQQDQAPFTKNSDYCSVRQARVSNITEQNKQCSST